MTYDLDGNLTFDGVWSYAWDAENRLSSMSMTNLGGVADANRLRLEFIYDCQGRRFSKTVKSWSSSTNAFGSPVTTLFIYDGANLVAELATLNPPSVPTVQRSYVWGLDLSRSLHGAGGVGGLLLLTTYGVSDTNCFVSYDGNGNVTALVNAVDSSPYAHYEYSPHGEPLRATGPMAIVNPFRFSTKYTENESGLVYYGLRYYSAASGRWISRDPIREVGGVNLYAMCRNRSLNSVDRDGRDEVSASWGWGDIGVHESWDTMSEVKAYTADIAKDFLDLAKDMHLDLAEKALSGISGAAGALVAGGAEAFISSALAMVDASHNLLQHKRAETGTIVGNAEDFLLHIATSDKMNADLDAVTIAIQASVPTDHTGSFGVLDSVMNRTYATSDAIIAWGGVSMIEDYLTR